MRSGQDRGKIEIIERPSERILASSTRTLQSKSWPDFWMYRKHLTDANLYSSHDLPVFDRIDRNITNSSGRTHRDPPPHRRGLDRGASTSLSGSLWLIRRRWISMRCHPGIRCRSSGLIAGNLDVVQDTRTLLPWFDMRIPLLELLAIRKLVVDKGRLAGPRSAGDVLSSSKDFRNYHTIPIEHADGSPVVVGSFRSQRTERLYGSHDVMNGRGRRPVGRILLSPTSR